MILKYFKHQLKVNRAFEKTSSAVKHRISHYKEGGLPEEHIDGHYNHDAHESHVDHSSSPDHINGIEVKIKDASSYIALFEADTIPLPCYLRCPTLILVSNDGKKSFYFRGHEADKVYELSGDERLIQLLQETFDNNNELNLLLNFHEVKHKILDKLRLTEVHAQQKSNYVL